MTCSRSLLVLVLASSLLFGCKQGVGDRCEQSSDCSSGYCGGLSNLMEMTSAAGKFCTAGPSTGGSVDASTSDVGMGMASDTGTAGDTQQATDGADSSASDAQVSEAGDASDGHADTGDVGVGVDASPEVGSDAAAETGAETSAADGAADLPIETGAGG